MKSVMKTFLKREQTKLEIQFLGDCMNNAHKFAYKWISKKAVIQQDLVIAGGSGEARTRDHLIKSQMLYQLSYRPATGDNQGYQKSNKCQLY